MEFQYIDNETLAILLSPVSKTFPALACLVTLVIWHSCTLEVRGPKICQSENQFLPLVCTLLLEVVKMKNLGFPEISLGKSQHAQYTIHYRA